MAGIAAGGVIVTVAVFAIAKLNPLTPSAARSVALSALALLFIADVWAVLRNKFFPLTLHRQTRKTLMYSGHGDSQVNFVWGLDAGVGVLTYRMTSGVWALLVVTCLGMVAPLAILGYAVGFAGAIGSVVLWPVARGTMEARELAAHRRVEGLLRWGKSARLAYAGSLAGAIAALASS